MDMRSHSECGGRARINAEAVLLLGDPKLTRQNVPEDDSTYDTDHQCRTERDQRAIDEAARHEEIKPAEDQA